MFQPEELRAALVGTRFGAHLHHFQSIASTNTELFRAAAAGAPEGTVYLADEQTAGRGRGNHGWHSSPGTAQQPAGLYLSVLAKPSLQLPQALWLSIATGLAAHAAILSACGLAIDLRWPNDLVLPVSEPVSAPVCGQKLGGILVETAVEPDAGATLRYAVIGIGINLNQTAFPPELAGLATSLRLATGHPIPRTPLLLALLRGLDNELTLLESATADAGPNLFARFTRVSTWARGKRVHVPEQGGYTGTTAGLDSRGFLLVDADDGRRRTVLSGGVRAL